MIIAIIMEADERRRVLSDAQHGFRRTRGAYTANLQLKNAMKVAWQKRNKLYGFSWDMS